MARKSDNDANLGFLLAALFGLVVLGLMVGRALILFFIDVYNYWKAGKRDADSGAPRSWVHKPVGNDPTLIIGDDYVECRNFMNLGHWDDARRELQKIAYGMLDRSNEEKQRFKKLMTEFAQGDPLVGSVLQIITPLLREQPGFVQSGIYKHMPGIGPEESRYALYFLEQLGTIRREKSGRSYKLYLSGEIIDV